MNTVVTPVILGLSEAMILVLVASGLSLTFGAMRLINMAHGGFFMLGAFIMASLVVALPHGLGWFACAVVCSTAGAAVLGVIAERVVYRRMYRLDHLSGLLASFALMLVFQGGVEEGWGTTPRLVLLPQTLIRAVTVAGVMTPLYEVLIIPIALICLAGLGAFLYLTRLGLETRVVAFDRQMAELLGIRVSRLSVATFVLGCALAGLGGALLAPLIQVDSTIGSTYVVLAFTVVLIGGMGSLLGTLLGGLLLGLADAFFAIDYPALGGYGPYLVLLAVLVLRPSGLFGKALKTGEMY